MRAIAHQDFIRFFANTVLISCVSTVLNVLTSLVAAYVFAKNVRFSGSALWSVLVIHLAIVSSSNIKHVHDEARARYVSEAFHSGLQPLDGWFGHRRRPIANRNRAAPTPNHGRHSIYGDEKLNTCATLES